MQENKKFPTKIVVGVLIVFLLGSLGYIFYSNREHTKLTDSIKEEKNEIQADLDDMILKFDEAIAQNTSMSEELIVERGKIVLLRDSVKDLEKINYNIVRRYRRHFHKFEEEIEALFYKNDSLVEINKGLLVVIDSVNVKIVEQQAKFDTLAIKNIELTEKVIIGSFLKVNDIKVLSMRERSNGKLVETSRSRNTDAFRINFRINENLIAEQGERNAYIQIVDPGGNTVSGKDVVTFEDGTEIMYSDLTSLSYINEPIDVISLVEVNRDDNVKGNYTVKIFLEERFVGSTNITLK